MAAFTSYWERWVQIDKWFADNADIKPYFYHAKEFPAGPDRGAEQLRDRADSAAEMLLDSFAAMYFQRDLIENSEESKVYAGFMRRMYSEQPYFRAFVDAHIQWYSPGFGKFIRGSQEQGEPASIGQPNPPLQSTAFGGG